MAMTRIIDIRNAHSINEFRIKHRRTGETLRLVKQQKCIPGTFHYDLFMGDEKVITLMERGVASMNMNVSGDIDKNSVRLFKIDLGDEGGGGVGFTVLNILARIAQEHGLTLSVRRTANMGLANMLERVSDFRFQDIARDEFMMQGAIDLRLKGFDSDLGGAGIEVAAKKISDPKILFQASEGAYWIFDERVARILFRRQKNEMFVKKIWPASNAFSPDIPIGTRFDRLWFGPGGAILFNGWRIGYSLGLDFQIAEITGKNPRPVEDLSVEVIS